MERNFISVGVKAYGVIGAGFVEEEEVNNRYCCNNKRKEKMEGEEPGEGCVIY